LHNNTSTSQMEYPQTIQIFFRVRYFLIREKQQDEGLQNLCSLLQDAGNREHCTPLHPAANLLPEGNFLSGKLY